MPHLAPILFSIWSRGVQIIKLQGYYYVFFFTEVWECRLFKVVFLEYSRKEEIQFVNAEFLFCRDSPQWARAFSFTRFLFHTQRRTTLGRTPLGGWSTRRRDLYLTSHNTTEILAPGGIRTHNLSKRAAANLRLRPRGHLDRQWWTLL